MKFALAAVSTTLAAIATLAQAPPNDWRDFRRQYPYHVQAIALSSPDDQGARTLIVAEPPPSTTTQSLASVDALLRDATVRAHALGTDGWVKDVVYRLPPVREDRLTALVDRLTVELFGTSYKAHTLPITGIPSARRLPLDLQVSATQLQDWTASATETFRPLGRGAALTLTQLLSASTTGVFYSTTPGLVAWILPRQADLAAFKRHIRQFALDSDVILGAVPGGTHVAVLARERQLPIELLPPLRSETILRLAEVGEDQLSQSYDRNDYGAGKLVDNRDWAPIYLSDELIDTEYGSLLNITDQLLKSWTNVGRMTYEGFTYPAPKVWPFKMPLGDLLQARALTYNWNTKGAGYSLATTRGRVFALNRTGALPVSYMPEGIPVASAPDTARYEDAAYDFFAADTEDPNLARVVQYAALYQVFQHFTTRAAPLWQAPVDHPEMAALTGFVQRALQVFADADDEGIRSIASANGFPRLQPAGLAKLSAARDALRVYRGRALDRDLSFLARQTANPRAQERSPASLGGLDSPRERALIALRRELNPLTFLIMSSDRALDVYRQASRRNPKGWIRTPSYVISTSRRPEAITGGHNLDSRVTVFEANGSVPRGTVAVRVNERGERVFTVNSLDSAQVGRLVRTAAREDAAQLKASVETLLRTAAPKALPRNAALGLPPTLGPAGVEANRGLVPTQLSSSAHRGGWALSGHPAAADYKSAGGGAVFVDRNADFTFRVTLAGSEGTYAAASYDSAVDLVAQSLSGRTNGTRPLTVFFSDVDASDAAKFMQTLEVRAGVAHRGRPAAAFGRSELGSFGRLREALGRSYDFKSARVSESVVERVATGGERLRVTVEVPALEAMRPPLLVRIKIFFAERVAEPIRRSVEQVVARVLRRSLAPAAPAPITGADIAAAIRADLRALHPEVELEVGIDLGVGDFYVAEASGQAMDRGLP